MLSQARNPALSAVVALLALFLVACGQGSEEEAPAKVLARATLDGVSSGTVDLALSAKASGRQKDNLDVTLSGPFRVKEGFPELAVAARAEGRLEGEEIDFEGGITLLEERGFLAYEGVEYEIDPNTFNIALPALLPIAPGRGGKAPIPAVTACVEAAADVDVTGLVENPVAEGGVEVEGASTTKVSGDLDADRAADAILALAGDPACAAQLAEAGLSPQDLEAVADDLTGTAKTARIEVYVGDDDIVRRMAGSIVAEPRDGDRGEVATDFELTLGEVNEEPEIEAPAKSKPIGVWLAKIGIEGFEALSIFSEKEALARLLELAAADAFPGLRP